jgi:hypothetical protein
MAHEASWSVNVHRAGELAQAIWAGDQDKLWELAPCRCCCDEHTFSNCPARVWGGCKSGLEPGVDDGREAQEWQQFYEREHGMSRETFYGLDRPTDLW